jgi:glutamate synthase (NADPH/NADH) small chain
MTLTPSLIEHAPHVTVLVDRCAGCQECVIRCPTGALSMELATWTAIADDSACVGCRQCVRTCPFSAITVEGAMLVADRYDPPLRQPVALLGNIEETRVGFATWEEAVAEANRCLECPDPTCVRGCPAHNNIPEFIAAVREGDLAKAHRILSRTTVLPDICSRVCNQSAQCEGSCSWSLAGGVPVAIGRIERFITDHAPVPAPSMTSEAWVEHSGGGMSVGVIGSGPAGIGAAWDLIESGASVTVYEKESTPGGLCMWGMPDFTLPEAVATRPWEQLTRAGVDLRCATSISPEDIEGLLREHDAVVVAHGAGVAIRLPVPGADLEGVVDATPFLQGAKIALESDGGVQRFLKGLGLVDENLTETHFRVLVLGAGNTAMDVARIARRLGLETTCIDWLDERFALARPDELAEARHEGVDVRFQRTLTALHGFAGRVAQAELTHTIQKEVGRLPKVLTGRHDRLKVNLVVMAMGYRVDPAYAGVLPNIPIRKKASGVPHGGWSASGIMANAASTYANHNPVGVLAMGREVALWAAASPVDERLWVVGDALTGPSTVVEAMAQGRRAARAILDAQPSRPNQGHDRSSVAKRVLVCHESVGGTTMATALAIADQIAAFGARVTTLPISKVGAREFAAADVVVVGTWVEGLVVARVHPAAAMRKWLDKLPQLGSRPIGIFCTYGVDPKLALSEMRAAIEAKGGHVAGEAAFGPKDRKSDAEHMGSVAFVRSLVSSLSLQVTTSSVPKKAIASVRVVSR